MASELITLAERYVLESEIARGGMAVVYRARDDVLARTVAVKVLHPHLADDEAFLDRFRFEALAAARLAHPNIVSIYDTGAEEGGAADQTRHFIVMEYCGGGSLAEHLRRDGPFQPERGAVVGSAVCEALAYAHRSGVIHRDIKPANVLVAGDGATLKVADFGIAKAAFGSGDVTTTGSILGTVTYLSPEQLKGEEPDQRSDIYSCGVMLYELLAGRAPFEEETQMAIAMKHLREEPPPLRAARGGIPKSIETIVMKAMAKDPAVRYQNAQEMRAALESSSVGSTTAVLRRPTRKTERVEAPARRPDARPRRSRRSRSGPFIMLGVIALVVAVISILLLTLLNNGNDPEGGGSGSGGAGGNSEGGDDNGSLEVQSVVDFDPQGTGGEHPDEVDLVVDGDPATSWTTENYDDPLELLGKDGVGLVFDLGDAEVGGVEVQGCAGCGLQIGHSSSDPSGAADATGFETVGETESAAETESFDFDATTDRYWLVFITTLPGGGGGSAAISEVTFGGP
ncbi:MAG: protein kinase domain-containing protein [Actinomycetota bacterium]